MSEGTIHEDAPVRRMPGGRLLDPRVRDAISRVCGHLLAAGLCLAIAALLAHAP